MSISSCNLNSATESNKIGIQLYSLRDEMVKDPKETLAKVALMATNLLRDMKEISVFFGE